ncbi:MAG TPA: DUF4142 domain-containing protein [Cyclobacteriaceae bacterium]|jgi:putative membrane protein|nr:DUF4142 domain-containing protein [Cyclobacteriaceae bacterium]
MKQYRHFKILLLLLLAFAILASTTSFTNFNRSRTRVAYKELGKTDKDAQFLAKAAELNLDEIQLGKLAQQKSMMTDVQELGKSNEDDHNQSLIDLTALAQKKAISLPTNTTHKAQDEYKTLSNKTESHFNKAYCERVIKDNKEAMIMFEEASKVSSDADIKEWITKTIPMLRTHLNNATLCKTKCEKM